MGSSASKPAVETKSGEAEASQMRSTTSASTDAQSNQGKSTLESTASSSASDATESSSSESKCPMHQGDGTYSYDWRALLRPSFPHGPGGKKPMTEEEARANITRRLSSMDATMASPGTGCPIKEQEYNVYAQPIDPKNNMPQEANQLPAPGQSKPLSTDRVKSNIPKGGTSSSSSSSSTAGKETTWTYPSPQMFYNALARKGKLHDTDETDIASVVALHNNMNEKTWAKVLEWEAVLNGDNGSDNDSSTTATKKPKLLKFTGRPTDLSPKAWFKHYILGHPLPFDRHDWTVLRSDNTGTTVRYVIDYYYDESRAREDASSSMPPLQDFDATPSLLIDVRPALDGPTQVWNRVVTMPWARHFGNAKYEPMPWFPTSAMKQQVHESVHVWQSIQLAVAGTRTKEEQTDTTNNDHTKNIPPLSDKEAIDLAKNLGKALEACRHAQLAMDNCGDTQEEYTRASLDLTMCLGKILCPLQHDTLSKAAQGDNDRKMEAALSSLNECVLLKTTQHEMSRRKQQRQ